MAKSESSERLPRRAIIFRTHYDDAELLNRARDIAKHSDRYQVVFAVDERKAEIETYEFPKISLTYELFSSLGLITKGEDLPLWRCGDYCFYATTVLPEEYEFLWLFENDAFINMTDVTTNFFSFMDSASTHDLLASYVGPARSNWHWKRSLSGKFDQVYQCYYPIIRLSARAVKYLLNKRREFNSENAALPDLTNDEAFTATYLADAGFTMADFNNFGSFYTTSTFSDTTIFHPTQISKNDNMLYHSVRSGHRFLSAPKSKINFDILSLMQISSKDPKIQEEDLEAHLYMALLKHLSERGDNPTRLLAPDSQIALLLKDNCTYTVFHALIQALAFTRMIYTIEELRRLLPSRSWPQVLLLNNVALAKPAFQSSVCRWSPQRNASRDAEGGNNGNVDVEIGFHTDNEINPWWTVDLLKKFNINKIKIFNRKIHANRLQGFIILRSFNGLDWTLQHDSKYIDIGHEITLDFDEVFLTRYLRIQINGQAILHLREVEVFGFEE